MQPLLDAPLTQTLRESLIASSVQELGRQGFRQVKVIPREAVERLLAEAQASRAEALYLREQLERERLDRGAAERRAEALRLDREAARDEAEEARRARAEALRHAAEAEDAFQGARSAALAAEAALAEARAGFEAQLRALVSDPTAFGAAASPERRARRMLARKRACAAVRRLAAEVRTARARPSAEASGKRLQASGGPAALELVWRRSVGFGLGPVAPAAAATETPGLGPRASGGRARAPSAPDGAGGGIEARLAAIEAKIEQVLTIGEETAREVREAVADGHLEPEARGLKPAAAEHAVAGRPGGLKANDPRFGEKRAILRRLLEENVRLRKAIAGG